MSVNLSELEQRCQNENISTRARLMKPYRRWSLQMIAIHGDPASVQDVHSVSWIALFFAKHKDAVVHLRSCLKPEKDPIILTHKTLELSEDVLS